MKRLNHIISKRLYGTINLVSKNNEILYSMSNEKAALNWYLAKYHIIPSNHIEINTIPISTSSEDTQVDSTIPKIISTKEKGVVKFTQFYRKFGKLISQGNPVYVMSGESNGKNIKIISSEKDSLEEVSTLIEKQDDIKNSAITILYLTKDELNVKPFIFTNPEEKVILTNTKNLNQLKEIIVKL